MTLLDVVKTLALLDPNSTVYAARPWSCASPSIVAQEPSSGLLPAEAEALGLEYFLEIQVAQEFVADQVSRQSGAMEAEEQCRLLIHYAVYDA